MAITVFPIDGTDPTPRVIGQVTITTADAKGIRITCETAGRIVQLKCDANWTWDGVDGTAAANGMNEVAGSPVTLIAPFSIFAKTATTAVLKAAVVG